MEMYPVAQFSKKNIFKQSQVLLKLKFDSENIHLYVSFYRQSKFGDVKKEVWNPRIFGKCVYFMLRNMVKYFFRYPLTD